MNDQAEKLRSRLLEKSSLQHMAKTLAVVSGKGGVGKSNFSLNLAISLCKKGERVLLFDMDIGMGNLDILMGRTSLYSIADFFDQCISLKQIVSKGPHGLSYIAGGTGLSHIVKLKEEKLASFMEQLDVLMANYDYMIFDMGAGITEESAKFILSVQKIAVITTPEPTSITDAYSAMKQIHLLNERIPFYLVINRTQSEKEGQETFKRISAVLKRFLGRDSNLLGVLPDDCGIQQAVKRQIPFVLFQEKSSASKAIRQMAFTLSNSQDDRLIGNQQSSEFISKLKNFFLKNKK
ncbi:MinD/ParA family protein [Cytobacillus sp. NCCP-133]|uniref:MinD/ParA family protein n=1 Tax=Cytobacillus sp. NCCP-133 TaxID=766848 RepID=UPI0022324A07|nr:MinD/ParA family protein [Cytobacillus sp. NCCP-133]GLB59330.1 flagellum site-determining protein YlxH [Cytobacillus sp. NCCP-133]